MDTSLQHDRIDRKLCRSVLPLLMALVAVTMVLASCSDDDTSSNNDSSDIREGTVDTSHSDADDTGADDTSNGDSANGDTGSEDSDSSDGSDTPGDSTSPVSSGCKNVDQLDTTLTLAPEEPAGQIYARAASDGQGVWVTYSQRESESESAEDVYVVHVGCDGEVDVGPTKVNTTASGIRDYDPSVDVQGRRVYVVWTSDSGGSHTVSYRVFDIDGTPLDGESLDITPVDGDGEPISNLIWELDIAGLPGGGAVVVGSYGRGPGFGVFAQRIDDQGNLTSSAIDVYTGTPQSDQYTPMVAAESAEDVWISWNNDLGDQLPDTVVYRTLDLTDPQSAEPTEPDSHEAFSDNGLPAPFAEPIPDSGHVFLAYTTSTFDVKLAALDDESDDDITLGSGSSVRRHRPGIAPGPNGEAGLVAWYNMAPSQIENDLMIQTFSYNSNSGLSAGTPQPIASGGSGDAARIPYGPSVVHVGEGVYFIAWSEGPSTSEGRIVGRFVEP